MASRGQEDRETMCRVVGVIINGRYSLERTLPIDISTSRKQISTAFGYTLWSVSGHFLFQTVIQLVRMF